MDVCFFLVKELDDLVYSCPEGVPSINWVLEQFKRLLLCCESESCFEKDGLNILSLFEDPYLFPHTYESYLIMCFFPVVPQVVSISYKKRLHVGMRGINGGRFDDTFQIKIPDDVLSKVAPVLYQKIKSAKLLA